MRPKSYYRFKAGGVVAGFVVGGIGAGVFWAFSIWFGTWLGEMLAGGRPEYVRLYGHQAVTP